MSREEWLQAQFQLEQELGEEPTVDEIEERCADNLAKEIDKQYELQR